MRLLKVFRILIVDKFKFSNKVFVITKNIKLELVEYLLFVLDFYCIVNCKYCFKHIDSTLCKI